MPLLRPSTVLLTLLFTLILACQKKSGNGGKTRTPEVGKPSLESIFVEGATTINAGECQKFTVNLLGSDKKPFVVASDEPFNLASSGGKWFRDENCSIAYEKNTFTKDSSKEVLYFKHNDGSEIRNILTLTKSSISKDWTFTVLPVTSLSLSESSPYDFGSVYTSTERTKLFTLSNQGLSTADSLSIPNLTTPFSVTTTTCGTTLAASSDCSITVRFFPTAVGTFNDTLSVNFKEGTIAKSVVRTLTGKGVISGSSDSTFGTNGKLSLSFGEGDDRAFSIIALPNSKTLVAGASYQPSSGYDFSVAKLEANGGLDTTFGTGGKVVLPILGGEDRALSMSVDNEGKILLGGYSYNGSHYDFSLARLEANGSLDTSFGNAGKVTVDFGSNDYGFSILARSDGKIFVLGYAYNSGVFSAAASRLNHDGSLDSTFGNGGKTTFSAGTGSSYAFSGALQNDGKLIVAGYASRTTTDFFVARLNENGTMDSSFGSSGLAYVDFSGTSDYAYAVTADTTGSIFVTGSTTVSGNNRFAIAKLTTSGALDTTFNGTGKNSAQLGQIDEARALAIQSDGSLLIAGNSFDGTQYDFGVARFLSTGILDTSFNRTGKLVAPIGSGTDRAYAIALQTDGKSLIAGDSHNGLNLDFGVLRLFP